MFSVASPTTVMKIPMDSPFHSMRKSTSKSKLSNIPETPGEQQQQHSSTHQHTHQHTHQQPQRHRHQSNRFDSSSVQVAVRIRPLLTFENGNESCVEVFPEHSQTSILKTMSSGSTALSSNDSLLSSDHNNVISPSNSMSSYQTLQIGADKGDKKRTYTFDHVFPSSTPQIDVYERCVTPLVQSCIEGYNATVLAYGQTGSGKTYTILGESSGDIDDMEGTMSNEGVIPRALKEIFNGLENLQHDIIRRETVRDEDLSFGDEIDTRKGAAITSANDNPSPFDYHVKIQFLEVYGEDIRDLLSDSHHSHQSKGRMQLHRQASISSTATVASIKTVGRSTISIRDGKPGEDAEVLGAINLKVTSAEEALQHLYHGLTKRIVGKTAMNENSSRSHAIFTVTINQTRRKKSKSGGKMDVEMKTSKIHIVDLCGSERVKRSMTIGKRLKEGIDINKGLLVLGNVISALSSSKGGSKAHIPYRDSKLTRLLKGSLGGNHKTLMIACISPSGSNKSESNNTLRYANRAKNIKNKAKINVDPSSRVVNELKGQVVALAAELLKERRRRENSGDHDDDDVDDCPFSIDFLDELVSGSNSKSLWMNKKRAPQKSNRITAARPQTEPPLGPSRPSHDENLVTDSWDVSETEIQTMFEVPPSRESTPGGSYASEDSNVVKDIMSYDFALRKLKESFEEKSDPQIVKEKDVREITPSLGKVRNIDELYDYLHKPSRDDPETNVDTEDHEIESESISEIGSDVEANSVVETESNDEINNVVKSHITKLDETLAHNESLLLEMTKCHRQYEILIAEYVREQQKIQDQVNAYDKDKRKFENVIDLIEEGSQYSDSMIECLKDYEIKLEQLKRKRNELTVLTQVANQNDEDIQNLQKSIEVVRQQRDRMRHVINGEVLPAPDSTVTKYPIISAQLDEAFQNHDLPSADPLNYQKKVVCAEASEITELRQEIELLKKRLNENEGQSRFESDFKIPTKNYEEHLVYGRDSKGHMTNMNPTVPWTLHLNSNSGDCSTLEQSLNGIPAWRRSPQDAMLHSEHNQTSANQQNNGDNGYSSLMSKRQGRRKQHSFMTQINTNSDQIFQSEEICPSNAKKIYSIKEKDYEYDLGLSSRTVKRKNKKTGNTSKSRSKKVECEEICAGGKRLVDFIRGIFGTKKDPVVRQW